MWNEFYHDETIAFQQSLSCYVQAINGRGIITCGGTIVSRVEDTPEGRVLLFEHTHGPEWGSEYLDPPEG